MPKSSSKPKPTEAQGKPSPSENLDKTDRGNTPQEMDTAAQKSATDSEAAVQSKDWWVSSPPVGEWAFLPHRVRVLASESQPSRWRDGQASVRDRPVLRRRKVAGPASGCRSHGRMLPRCKAARSGRDLAPGLEGSAVGGRVLPENGVLCSWIGAVLLWRADRE